MLYEAQNIVQNATGVLNDKKLKKLRELSFSIQRRDTIISYDTIVVIELVLPQEVIYTAQENKERIYEEKLKEYNRLCLSENGRVAESLIDKSTQFEKEEKAWSKILERY
jgi:hypothetical protein